MPAKTKRICGILHRLLMCRRCRQMVWTQASRECNRVKPRPELFKCRSCTGR